MIWDLYFTRPLLYSNGAGNTRQINTVISDPLNKGHLLHDLYICYQNLHKYVHN